MLQHLIAQFSISYLSTGRLREVKNKIKFQIFSSKSGRGCLREAVAYKMTRGFKYSDLTWKILVVGKTGR